MDKKTQLLRIFQITFFLGYVFRISVTGWYLVIFFIPEYLFRSLYYVFGVSLLDDVSNKTNIKLNIALQFFYLLASFFTYDGGDQDIYTFASLWVNPPTFILMLWAVFCLITIILIFVSIYFHIKQNQGMLKIKNWGYKILIGCIIIPGFALYTGFVIDKLRRR